MSNDAQPGESSTTSPLSANEPPLPTVRAMMTSVATSPRPSTPTVAPRGMVRV